MITESPPIKHIQATVSTCTCTSRRYNFIATSTFYTLSSSVFCLYLFLIRCIFYRLCHIIIILQQQIWEYPCNHPNNRLKVRLWTQRNTSGCIHNCYLYRQLCVDEAWNLPNRYKWISYITSCLSYFLLYTHGIYWCHTLCTCLVIHHHVYFQFIQITFCSPHLIDNGVYLNYTVRTTSS